VIQRFREFTQIDEGGIVNMRKRLTAALLGSGAAALALGLGTATAMATTATTWSITPGGAVTGAAGQTTLKDTKTGTVLKCQSSATKATLKKGSRQANPIGKITSVTFTSCTGPGGLHFTATTSASKTHPWNLDASTFSSGVTHGMITGITAALSGNGCTATVAGTTSKTPGKVTGSYSNSTHVLSVSGGNLHVWNVSSGCLGLIKTGDGTTFVGKYTIKPPQTIKPS
jgi:hypothetical protein